jgi:hypothetical protein
MCGIALYIYIHEVARHNVYWFALYKDDDDDDIKPVWPLGLWAPSSGAVRRILIDHCM